MPDIPFLDLVPPKDLLDELSAAFHRTCASGHFVLGSEVEAFETEFAHYCQVRHCVGVGNGLDALRLVLQGYGIGPGDEVLVPSNTYIATWLAVSAVGADVVPVEPDPLTHNIDPEKIEASISARTRAIIAVHLYGRPADMQAILPIGKRHGLKIIEDAAQAHGAFSCGKPAGGLGDAGCFSFYPTKNLGAMGDGGAITTNDQALAEAVRMLRNYGVKLPYQHEVCGSYSRLDELQAAFLRVKLKRLDAWNMKRRSIAKMYLRELCGSELELPPKDDINNSAWHLFVVRHPRRDNLKVSLQKQGIATMIHYPVPPHRQPAYADLKPGSSYFPLADLLSAEVLSLPLHPWMSSQDSSRVCDAAIVALKDMRG